MNSFVHLKCFLVWPLKAQTILGEVMPSNKIDIRIQIISESFSWKRALRLRHTQEEWQQLVEEQCL